MSFIKKSNELFQIKDKPKLKYLVFTSAGDNSNLDNWLERNRNFDLWVSYYGNEQDRYKDISDYYIAKKGGKFPALHYAYQHWRKILDQYQAILVMDDDIIIDASAISRLFEIHEKYDLWLLQPTFDPKGKISHNITKTNPDTFMRYTNFVEMTCPLFRKDKLDEFMKVYDPVLVGWGTDLWFMEVLGPDAEGKVAVVDEISCINPHDNTKGNQREIDLLQKTPDRIKNWKKIKEKHNLQNDLGGFIEYGSIVPQKAIFKQVIQPKNKEINSLKNQVGLQEEEISSLKDKVKLQDKAVHDLQEEVKRTKNSLRTIISKIHQLVTTSGKTEPIKKYKAYKEMLKTYYTIRRNTK